MKHFVLQLTKIPRVLSVLCMFIAPVRAGFRVFTSYSPSERFTRGERLLVSRWHNPSWLFELQSVCSAAESQTTVVFCIKVVRFNGSVRYELVYEAGAAPFSALHTPKKKTSPRGESPDEQTRESSFAEYSIIFFFYRSCGDFQSMLAKLRASLLVKSAWDLPQ